MGLLTEGGREEEDAQPTAENNEEADAVEDELQELKNKLGGDASSADKE